MTPLISYFGLPGQDCQDASESGLGSGASESTQSHSLVGWFNSGLYCLYHSTGTKAQRKHGSGGLRHRRPARARTAPAAVPPAYPAATTSQPDFLACTRWQTRPPGFLVREATSADQPERAPTSLRPANERLAAAQKIWQALCNRCHSYVPAASE